MQEIALIKCIQNGEHMELDIKGELGNILTTVGIALYQIETSLPEDRRSEYRTSVLEALAAPRQKYKGGKINEKC